MLFEQLVKSSSFALSEGSLYERLRRHPDIDFDPHLAHATLIYEPQAAKLLAGLHREYLDVGQRYGLAMFALTDTWRANQERLHQSKFHRHRVNQDNANFLVRLKESYGPGASPILIGGQIGPRGDAYAPEAALAAGPAEQFHNFQVGALAEANVDFLLASTLPACSEAQGMATALARTGLPYVLSFVIRRDGTLLDGTPLSQAIAKIDDTSPKPPTGYGVNCVHPAVFRDGLAVLERECPGLSRRIVSFQANTSARDPKELDGRSELETESPATLADAMLEAYRRFRTPFLGGCCGTDASHIEALARAFTAPLQQIASCRRSALLRFKV
jgi:homocysteine S-methyltransferase